VKRLNAEIINFFENQGFVVVSTIDEDGHPHNSCKGIVKINKNGLIYLLDLFRGRTYNNLKQRLNISITAIDENRFTGYSLKGRAKIVERDKISPQIINDWDKIITRRITERFIRAIKGEKGHRLHPEALLPKPQYLIVMKVDEIIDLTPHHLK